MEQRREKLGAGAAARLVSAERNREALGGAGAGLFFQRAPHGLADDARAGVRGGVPVAADDAARPRHGAHLLSDDAGFVLCRLRQRAADGRWPWRRRGRGGAGLSDVRARESARGDVAQSVERSDGQGISNHSGAAGHRFGRPVRRGPGAGHAGEDSRLLQRLHLRRHLRTAGAGVRRAAAGGLCAADSARGDGGRPRAALV